MRTRRQALTTVMVCLVLAVSSLAVAPAASTAPDIGGSEQSGEHPDCPGPYCPTYRLACDDRDVCRFPKGPDGISLVDYWVYNWQASGLTKDEVLGAIDNAARAWEMYAPTMRFRYRGISDEPPIPGDGKTVIGWVPLVGAALVLTPTGDHPDLYLNALIRNFWQPCHTRCTPTEKPDLCRPLGIPVLKYPRCIPDAAGQPTELQGLLAHELGHIVGLGDLGAEEAGLTMTMIPWGADEYPGGEYPPDIQPRYHSTLGLGDIIGLRKMYPYECPKLSAADERLPDEQKRRKYPEEYRLVCPTYKIYVP